MVHVTHTTKSISAKTIQRKWHIIDAKNIVLGRASTQVASLLIGKSKVTYSPNLDMGDFVVVINASKVKVTGRKKADKIYQNYSGYPGGLREQTMARVLEEKPEEVLRHSISGMLPKNKLRDRRLARLYIYADETHPHTDKIS